MTSRLRWTAALVAMLSVVASAQAEDWTAVSAANGKFRFETPSPPTSENSSDTDNGAPYVATIYTSIVPGFVVIADYSEYQSDKVKVELSLVVSGFLKGLKGEMVSNQPTAYEFAPGDTLEGTVVVAQTDAMQCKMRVVVDRVHVYALAACVGRGDTDTSRIDRALASFTLTK